jgi:hypothetical protein
MTEKKKILVKATVVVVPSSLVGRLCIPFILFLAIPRKAMLIRKVNSKYASKEEPLMGAQRRSL